MGSTPTSEIVGVKRMAREVFHFSYFRAPNPLLPLVTRMLGLGQDRQTKLTFQGRADTGQPVISAASGFGAQSPKSAPSAFPSNAARRRAACRDQGPQQPAAGGERPHAAAKWRLICLGAAGKAANLGGCKSLYRQLLDSDGEHIHCSGR